MISARFETSADGLASCPPADLPELAICGRSNVGKSSLLNAFVGQRGLARVGRTPGRTRLLNVFRIDLESPAGERVPFRCVDLPGYGFARASRVVRESFAPMVDPYVRERSSLRGVLLLIDARRSFDERDFDLLERLAARGLPALVVATKIDKLGVSERGLVAQRFADALGVDRGDILLTSASERIGLGDERGRGGLARDVGELVTGAMAT